jgi:hypothetical protein
MSLFLAFPSLPWVLVGVLLLVLFLVARAPASLLQRVVPINAGPAGVGMGGTVWQGQAEWVQQGASGLLSWRIKPWGLFWAGLWRIFTRKGRYLFTEQ